MTEHEDNRVHYLLDACEVRGHLDINPDDLSLILIHQRELGKEDALADLAEHDKEVRNKALDAIIKAFDDYCAGCCEECNIRAFKYIVERMKEGGEE